MVRGPVPAAQRRGLPFRAAALRPGGGDLWREEAAGRPGEEWKAHIDRAAALLNPLGIEWYDSILPLGGSRQKQIRSGSEEDFQTLLRLALYVAERGGHFCLLYDEVRFPLHPDDARDFGTAREADVRLVGRLFEAVRSRHPRFRLFFCPPFFWGPGNDPSETYGEPRDEYLKAVGALPQGIEVFWTGSRVKTAKADPAYARWMAGLIRRKPVYWQNGFGPERGGRSIHYGAEPIAAWKEWYPEGFFDELSLFTLNETSLMANMTLFDSLWNRKAYDPARSIEEANRKVMGPEARAKLADVCARLGAFDPYGWGPSAAAARDLEELKRNTEELIRAGRDLDGSLPPGMARWLEAGGLIAMRQSWMKELLERPDLAEGAAEDEKARAQALEHAPDPAGAVILTPWNFRAKRPAQRQAAGAESRFGIGVSGEIESTFPTPRPSPPSPIEMVACGLDAGPRPCRIRITLNGKTVFEGETPFSGDRFRAHVFPIRGPILWPPDTLDNRLVIANLGESKGPPSLRVSSVVLRAPPK